MNVKTFNEEQLKQLSILESEVKKAQQHLDECNCALTEFKELPENNVYNSLEEAECNIEDELYCLAKKDCEGSYNYGMDEYNQIFIVDGVKYIATLKVTYDRHDKTYYYIDSSKFSYEVFND